MSLDSWILEWIGINLIGLEWILIQNFNQGYCLYVCNGKFLTVALFYNQYIIYSINYLAFAVILNSAIMLP